MKIGLCGAQGTGKTTLAKAYSEASGVPYIDAKVGEFLSDIGVDLSRSDMPIVERMKAQLMVARHIASITEAPGLHRTGFITDRTPIDVMAYSHDIAVPHHRNDEVLELYAKIHMVCLDAAAENFNLCLMLRPGVKLSSKDHCRNQRASLQPFYVNHIDMLMTSMIMSFSKKVGDGSLSRFALMQDDVIDLELRLDALREIVGGIALNSVMKCEPCH
ncbi:TPA: AAA family ATPase [Klebsiella aerogenes]